MGYTLMLLKQMKKGNIYLSYGMKIGRYFLLFLQYHRSSWRFIYNKGKERYIADAIYCMMCYSKYVCTYVFGM
jgi:hypothetical protein